MNSQTIVMCVVALILGMLLANMLKSVCGCNKVVEGVDAESCASLDAQIESIKKKKKNMYRPDLHADLRTRLLQAERRRRRMLVPSRVGGPTLRCTYR